jgi:Zn-dependent protease with chaperone function
MYAYIILGLVLAVFATDLLPADPSPHALPVVLRTAAVTVLVLLAGLAISGYILVRGRRIEEDEQGFLRVIGVLGKLYRSLVLAAYAVVLFGCGWGRLAASRAAVGSWDVTVLLANLAPLVILLVVAWTALYWADRRLRALMFERAGAPVSSRHWTFGRYLEFMLRQYLLVILVPMLALLTINDVAMHLVSPAAAGLVALAAVFAAAALAGPWVRVCWRTEPLPDGRLRRRLLELADRAGVRVAEVLVWRTNLSIANGCMIGVFGPFRYILITDALLLSLSAEEVEAVFAHEAAHVKYRHALVYLVMTMGAIAIALLTGEVAAVVTDSFTVGAMTVGTVILAYLVTAFGYVSRRCEQECDLYAVRATECPAACSPPDPGARADDLPPPAGQGGAVQEVSPAPAPPGPDCGQVDLAAHEDEAPAAAEEPVPPAGEEPAAAVAADGVSAAAAAAPAVAVLEPPSPPASAVCEHRVRTFVTALRRIARLNGSAETARGLRHFSIARRCRFLRRVQADPSLVRRAERTVERLRIGAVLVAIAAGAIAVAIFVAANSVVIEEGLQPDQPQDPAGPDDGRKWDYTEIVRLVDRNQVDAVALRPPQFHRDADTPAHLDDGGMARPRLFAPARHDDVAVAQARGHAVAVDAKGERARLHLPEAGQVQELGHPLRRGRRQLDDLRHRVRRPLRLHLRVRRRDLGRPAAGGRVLDAAEEGLQHVVLGLAREVGIPRRR